LKSTLENEFDLSISYVEKKAKGNNQKHVCSYNFVQYCNGIVKLIQQMRTEDVRYLELLDRLRHGKCNYDNYELLLIRVVGQPSISSLKDSPWNKVNFTFRF